MDTFRTTEDLSSAQQELAFQMAEGLWELLIEEGKERSMECISLENVIRLEIADIKCNPRAAGLSEEEVPKDEAETVAMENLVLQTLLERRRMHGGYVRWPDWRSFKNYMLRKYAGVRESTESAECTESADALVP